MIAIGGGLLAVMLLVCANGFFVAAEFALVTVRRTRIAELAAEGRMGARLLQDAVGHLDSYIAACQLGVTLASLALGWTGEPVLADALDPLLGGGAHVASAALAFTAITALLVMAGELAPKGIAIQHAERTALLVVAPLRLFRALFRPAIWVLNEGGWLFARLLGVRRAGLQSPASAAELQMIVQGSAAAGEIEAAEHFLLERVLRFGDLTVGEVMLPRTEVHALPLATTTQQAVAFVAEHRHSRYPVYRDSLDDVMGVLHVRDLLLAPPSPTLEPLLRQPLMVPAQANVQELLRAMREQRTQFAIAVDEYGGTDGIVTMEDVLEEIVGEIRDEFEEAPPPPSGRPGVIRIDGLAGVETLEELLGVAAEPGPYNTVAGFVVERIGRIPRVGDAVDLGGYRLAVAEMDDLRVAAVEATPLRARDGTLAPARPRPEG